MVEWEGEADDGSLDDEKASEWITRITRVVVWSFMLLGLGLVVAASMRSACAVWDGDCGVPEELAGLSVAIVGVVVALFLAVALSSGSRQPLPGGWLDVTYLVSLVVFVTLAAAFLCSILFGFALLEGKLLPAVVCGACIFLLIGLFLVQLQTGSERRLRLAVARRSLRALELRTLPQERADFPLLTIGDGVVGAALAMIVAGTAFAPITLLVAVATAFGTHSFFSHRPRGWPVWVGLVVLLWAGSIALGTPPAETATACGFAFVVSYARGAFPLDRPAVVVLGFVLHLCALAWCVAHLFELAAWPSMAGVFGLVTIQAVCMVILIWALPPGGSPRRASLIYFAACAVAVGLVSVGLSLSSNPLASLGMLLLVFGGGVVAWRTGTLVCVARARLLKDRETVQTAIDRLMRGEGVSGPPPP